MAKLAGKGVKPPKPSSVENSEDTYAQDWGIMIIGPTGAGKSFCLGSYSEQWPSAWPPKKKTHLEDTLWISFDNGATRGLNQFGITVEEIRFNKYFDPTKEGSTDHMGTAVQRLLDDAQTMVLHYDKRYVVLDAVSTLDYNFSGYWGHPDRMPKSKAGKPDGMAMWRLVQSMHFHFISKFWQLPCNVGIACHEKQVIYDADGVAKDKMTALTPTGEHDFIPGISGQSLGYYLRNCDLTATLLDTPVKGKLVRKLHAVNVQGHLTKNRLQEYMRPEEDPHLGNLMKTLLKRQKENKK